MQTTTLSQFPLTSSKIILITLDRRRTSVFSIWVVMSTSLFQNHSKIVDNQSPTKKTSSRIQKSSRTDLVATKMYLITMNRRCPRSINMRTKR